jgi:hypothetical protein
MVPLTTAAAVVMMAGVGSVYLTNRTHPESSVTLPSVTSQAAPPEVAKRDPEPDRVSNPLAARLPGVYDLQFTNLQNVAQLRGTMEIHRIGNDLFAFQMALAGYTGGMPFRHQYAGHVEKLGSAWYVNTTSTTDRTIALGRVPCELSFENGILTVRANTGVIESWRKR